MPDGTVVDKTAYEVSVGHLELLSEEPVMAAEQTVRGMGEFRSNAVLPQ